MIHYFDRSRTEIDHRCPRRLYWEYYWDGKGLQLVKLNQHLAFGGVVHEALATLLNYCKEFDNLPDMGQVIWAINAAKVSLREEFTAAKGFQSEATTEMTFDGEIVQVAEDQSWLIDHYCDLLEGLVVGWCLVRLPLLLQQYRVVQVETEETLIIPLDLVEVWNSHGNDNRELYVPDNVELRFLSRPDAILERRTDAATVILSFKTVSQPNQMWLENFKTDQQTISEVLPVEARLGKEVAGVQVEGLTKGAMAVEWPKGSGHKHHSSPLIWGYCIEAGGIQVDWKAQWEWVDESGNKRRLGKGWNRQRIAQSYCGGIAEWVGYLYQAENELLRAQFPSPPLVSRSAHELEEWVEQVKYREVEVHNALVQIEQGWSNFSNLVQGSNGSNIHLAEHEAVQDGYNRILAQVFPKHTDGCAYDPQYHSKCPCYELCWGSEGNDPIGSGRYKYREPNHPEG